MKLSVIIVSYNERQFLSQAIDSCLNQTFQDFEILIGDDGSSDGSLEIIEEYTKKYPRKIRYYVMDRPEDEIIIASYRVSNVIKRGLDMALGEYVLCLSGDDFYHDNTIFARQVEQLDKDVEQKYSACVSNYQLYWNDGKTEPAIFVPYSPGLSWSGWYVHVSCFMFRKRVYDSGFFLEHFCDDTGLAYSLACAGKWKYINRNAFSYRQRDKSIMHEADVLELKLLEVMLYQDIIPKRKLMAQSFGRFYGQIKYVSMHRDELTNGRYKKYIKRSQEHENNIIGMLSDYNNIPKKEKIKFFCKMRIMQFFAWYYFFWRVTFRIVSAIRN